jgi:hypothetical protein
VVRIDKLFPSYARVCCEALRRRAAPASVIAVMVVGGLDLRVAKQTPLPVLAADARLAMAGVVRVHLECRAHVRGGGAGYLGKPISLAGSITEIGAPPAARQLPPM